MEIEDDNRSLMNQPDHAQFLLQSFGMMRDVICDISLKVGVEGNLIDAHKFILCAASPYFYNMFTSIFEESTQSEIDLTHLSFQSVKRIINYIYFGEFSYRKRDLLDLFKGTDFLQLNGLRDMIYGLIMQNLKLKNCLQTWEFIIKFNVARTGIVDFISQNLTELLTDTKFLQLSVEKTLITDLVSYFNSHLRPSDDKFSDRFYDAVKHWSLNDLEMRKTYLPDLLPLLNVKNFSVTAVKQLESDNYLFADNADCMNWCFHILFNRYQKATAVTSEMVIITVGDGANISLFDIRTRTVKFLPLVIKELVLADMVLMSDGLIIIIGGATYSVEDKQKGIYTYNYKSDQMKFFSMHCKLNDQRLCASDKEAVIYMFGGCNSKMGTVCYTSEVTKYDVANGTLDKCEPMPYAPQYFSVCKNEEGEVFLSCLTPSRYLCFSKYSIALNQWNVIQQTNVLLEQGDFYTVYYNGKIYLLQENSGRFLFYTLHTNTVTELNTQTCLLKKKAKIVLSGARIFAIAIDGAYILSDGLFKIITKFEINGDFRSIAV